MQLALLALVRIDDALVDRVRREDRLGELGASASIAIALGGGAYGAAFGFWRAPEQAVYGAVKLPLVLLSVALFTAASSAALAPLLGARLSARQAVVVALTSLAVTASILGALAPAVVVLVLAAPPCGHVGQEAAAQSLVLSHTLVIAASGTAGVLALLTLVGRLVASRATARRVVLAWLAAQLLVGAQLSWLLRPFLGNPTRPVTFLSPDALSGGFFEEILRLADARFGALAPIVLGWFALMMLVWIAVALGGAAASVVVHPAGLEVRSADASEPEVVSWGRIASASAAGPSVVIRFVRDEQLVDRTLAVPCTSLAGAASLAEAIETARSAYALGPYR